MPAGFPAALHRSAAERIATWNLRMAWISQMAQIGCEVRGSDEDTIHAVDRGDRLEVVQSGARLDLNEQAELVMNPAEVVGQTPVTVRP